MIKALSIQQYKGFYKKQTIKFAIPDTIKKGSGLTLIVGPNNTGKTTVIESLLITVEKKFKESERHTSKNTKVEITSTEKKTATFTNVRSGSVIENNGVDHGIKFELIPSRRFWQPEFGGSASFSSFINESARSNVRQTDNTNLGPLLNTILQDSSLKSKFDDLIKKIMPHFTDWSIDTTDSGQDYVKYKTRNSFHKSNLLGDGVISLFRIVAHLVHDEASTFIIDEPELSLHPTAQKRLSLILSELSKTKQIIVCSHSPYFANWSDFSNGTKIIRLNKHEDKECTVSVLDNNKNYATFIAKNIDEYQKPQLLDICAKEILFNDKILFVEGQEDVGLIRKWFKDNSLNPNFEIFGYGVGGEKNMKLFLEIAKDLNIGKVAALYDKGTSSFKSDQVSYADFELLQHSQPDIRDKKDKSGKVTTFGVFDSKGNIKAAESVKFSKIMNKFIKYFDT